jgi:hypothetical protein
MSKSPVACLNEVLLRAALRAERANEGRLLDGEASQLAKRNDNYASQYPHRVRETQTERTHDHTSQSMDS